MTVTCVWFLIINKNITPTRWQDCGNMPPENPNPQNIRFNLNIIYISCRQCRHAHQRCGITALAAAQHCTTRAQSQFDGLISSGTLLRAVTVNRLGFYWNRTTSEKESLSCSNAKAYREAKISQVVSEPTELADGRVGPENIRVLSHIVGYLRARALPCN